MPAPPGDKQIPRSEEVFISYSRKDKEFVHRLDQELRRRDREAWVDWEGIPPGDTWEKTIYGAIEATHTFIFVLTPDSIASQVCGKEIAHAAANNKRLVPIVHRDVAADSVPKSLGELNWIFCRESDDFNKATDTLIRALDTDLKWVRAHARLLTRAIEWDANSRNNSFVLRGDDLRSAERWLAEAGAQKERQPTALQTEYIIASRKASARRQRITLGGVIFALVVAIALAILAYLNASKTKETLANSDFLRADELIAQSRVDEALAFLARAARTQPRHSATADRIFTLLTQRGWILPASAPATLPGTITSICFTEASGCLAATISGDVAQVFDLRSGKPVTAPLRHDGQPVQIARLSANGKLLASASGGTKLDSNCEIWPRFRHYGAEDVHETAGSGRVWDVATGNPLTPPLIHPKAVLDICFDANSARVATASEDGTVRVCDIRTGKDVAAFSKHDSPVLSVRFSPDGKHLLAATTPLVIWDVASGERVSIPTVPKLAADGDQDEHGQGDRVIAAEYSPDGQQIAAVISGTDDDGHQLQHVQLLSAATGEPTPEKSESFPVISEISFDPYHKRVLVAYAGEYRNKDDTGGVDELDPESGKVIWKLPMYGTPVSSMAVLPRNGNFFTATIDRTVQLRQWEYGGQEVRPANPLKFPSPPRHIECAPSGAQFAVVFGNSGEFVQLCNTPTAVAESHIIKVSTKLADTPPMDSERKGRIVDTSRDGKRVLKFDSENSVIVCDARTGSRISGPFYPEGGYEGGGILIAKFSPKGDLLAIGEGGDFRLGKGYARIWDAKTGRPVTSPLVHTLAVTQLAFTEDAQRLFAVASDIPRSSHLSGRLWDVRMGIALGDQTRPEECELMSFDRNSGQITGYSEGIAKVWDATFPPHGAVPEWFGLLTEIVGGSRLNAETGAVEPVPEQWSKLQSLGAELAASTRPNPFTILAKWFLADSNKRMLSPYSKETRHEYIQRCLAEGSEPFLNEAERLAAGEATILERIKTKREEP